MSLDITADAISGMTLRIDDLPGEEAEQLKIWLEPILDAAGADVLVTDEADTFKQVSDEIGRAQHVYKSHVEISSGEIDRDLPGRRALRFMIQTGIEDSYL